MTLYKPGPLALLLMLALSGCVGVSPYGAIVVSPTTAMQEFFSGNGQMRSRAQRTGTITNDLGEPGA
jgi:hypothetical protein